MSEGVIIAVDLGGTRIRAARCDAQLNIQYREETRTLAHEGLEPTLGRIKAMIQKVMPTDGTPVLGVGICAPGPLNPETGVVVAPPNLPGWHNVPLGDILHEAFNVPIYVGNDANVAALAESLRGAAVGYKDVIYITVSTGIGGGVIVDGLMLLGKSGLGAEVGHMIMLAGDTVSTLEKESAGPALARKARARIEAGESSLISELVGGDLSQIEGGTVGQAALQGDALAVEVVQYAGRILGLGIVTLLHLFDPQIIVIGGGVANGVGDLLLQPMHKAIQAHALDAAYWNDLKIVPAKLSEDVSIVGSAALVSTRGGVRRITEVLDAIGR